MRRKLAATFLVIEDMLTTSITLPIEMMNLAESAAKARDASAPRLNIASASIRRGPVQTRSGFALTADLTLRDIATTEMVIIPSLWRNPRPILRKHREIIDWLAKLNQQGCLLIAVGTGVCFLAEAGVLRGKAATTHWHYFDQFQRDYPEVDLKRQYFITQSSNIYCAASVNAIADLTVHFIHRSYGKEVAGQVQRNFSHEIRRPYESTSYFDDKYHFHPDENIVQSQIWMQDNSQREIRLSEVARRFDMSVRTFNRRFREATGKSPMQYLQELRIDMAKDLLQTSNLSISEIAYKVGYQDVAWFSELFKAHLAISPSEYRATVRAKLFSTTSGPASAL